MSAGSIPACFGKEHDPAVPHCAGGPDPTYLHPVTQLRVRQRCDFYDACGARTAAATAANRLIAPQALLRPPEQQPQAQQGQPQLAPGMSIPFNAYLRASALQAEQTRQAAMAQPQQQRPFFQPQQQQQPHYAQPPIPGALYPAQQFQLNYMMPGYLTAPEQRAPGESVWSVVLREVLRAIFKSVGHTIAHHFDANTLKGPPPPNR
jgi:hypothetical protein